MRYFAILLGALLGMVPADAQSGTSTLLLHGKILTMDSRSSTSEALLVRDGRIAASGKAADLRKMAGPQARVIDLEGRTVIPGLIDSHMHAIRAALSFSTEVNWIGTRTVGEALDRIRIGGAYDDARCVAADCGGRLERATISRESATDAGGIRWRQRRTIRCMSSWVTAGRC